MTPPPPRTSTHHPRDASPRPAAAPARPGPPSFPLPYSLTPFHQRERRRQTAFTLMEILIVMTLIGILATLTFTLGESIRERGKASQARVELAILSTALESFKSRYGDYPQTGDRSPAGPDVASTLTEDDAEAALFNALTGVIDLKLETLKDADGADIFGKVFIEGARFSFEVRDAEGQAVFPETAGTPVANAFLDPWGRRYQYFYRTQTNPTAWTHPGFILYSAGSDGVGDGPASTGYPDYDAPANIDNLYAGRN